MVNPRLHGDAPYGVAVVHGGPGAPGEMAPVARELARKRGVLEPLQTRPTLAGQVEELKLLLDENGSSPITLIGYSWGALLSFIYTASNPGRVGKLILLSSAVFSDAYVMRIDRNRLSRMSARERARMEELLSTLEDPTVTDRDTPFRELGELISGVDAYDPIPHESDAIAFQYYIFEAVWREVEELRRSGELLRLGERITCPVVAIHGDFDPHPWEGIRRPLEEILHDFKFVLLEKCGHRPWYEKLARKEFYAVLENELA